MVHFLSRFDDSDPQLILQFFIRNFERAYNGKRPPFGLHMQAATLLHKPIYNGFMLYVSLLLLLNIIIL